MLPIYSHNALYFLYYSILIICCNFLLTCLFSSKQCFCGENICMGPLMHAWVLRCFSHVWLFVTLWTISHRPPMSMALSQQEYWSGLPFLPPGDLSDSESQKDSLQLLHWQRNSLPLNHLGRLYISNYNVN